MYKIFVVEDDAVIAGAVVEHIASWGWEARKAEDLTRVMEEFTAFAPHLVLLDIGLPFRNGYHWCAEIRKLSQVPIVFLSSASDNMNVVMAMNMGGDDFIWRCWRQKFRRCCGGPTTLDRPRRCWDAGERCWTPEIIRCGTRDSCWS